MQLRTTKTTFFPQKIQNKQNICLFQEFCVPPWTCLRTRITGWEPLSLNIVMKLTPILYKVTYYKETYLDDK